MAVSLIISLLGQRKIVKYEGSKASPTTRFCPKKGKIKEIRRDRLPESGGSCEILNPESGCVIPQSPKGILKHIFPHGSHCCGMRLEAGHQE